MTGTSGTGTNDSELWKNLTDRFAFLGRTEYHAQSFISIKVMSIAIVASNIGLLLCLMILFNICAFLIYTAFTHSFPYSFTTNTNTNKS